MKKYCLLAVLLILSTTFSFSQRLLWVTDEGSFSPSENVINDMITDPSGNSYVTGYIWGQARDIYIAKYNSSGTLLWQKVISGANHEEGKSIVLDASGNIYITGYFWSDQLDFSPGQTSHIKQRECPISGCDFFIAKYDTNGNYVWAKNSGNCAGSCGGSNTGNSIAIDHSGNILVTGSFSYAMNFDFNSNGNSLSADCSDIFVAKYTSDGDYISAFKLGNTSATPFAEEGLGIACDSHNNIYITGYFAGPSDFDPNPLDTFLLQNFGMFLAKYNPGGTFEWAHEFSNPAHATGSANDIVINANDEVYITGIYSDTVDFDPGPSTAYLIGLNFYTQNSQPFIAKYNSSGNYIWAKDLKSDTNNEAPSFFYGRCSAITLDQSQNIYITGSFNGRMDFDPGSDSAFFSSTGENVFFSKYNSSGKYLSGGMVDGTSRSMTIATDLSNNILVAGFYIGATDFESGCPQKFIGDDISSKLYIAKYSQSLNQTINTISNNFYCYNDSVYIHFNASGTFNLGNIFTAQISNQYGNFKTFTTVGTAVSGDSILIVLPPDLLNYGTYRLRVNGSNPFIVGCDNGADITIYNSQTVYIDNDNDFYNNGTVTGCFAPQLPSGYNSYSSGHDCDDNDALKYQYALLYFDGDNDNYNSGSDSMCFGAVAPQGYIYYDYGTDCNDADPSVYQNVLAYIDADNDSYDTGTDSVCIGGVLPEGFKFYTNGNDCDDDDAFVNPGSVEICDNGIDDNCNFLTDENCGVTLHLTLFIEGFYSGNNQMQSALYNSGLGNDPEECEMITVQLADPITYEIIQSDDVILHTNGEATVNYISVFNPGEYYIIIKGRNILETWSKNPVYLSGNSYFNFGGN